MSVEEAPYQSRLRAGAFEVRDYPALVTADVEVEGDQGQAANRGFRMLAGYIFGGNARREPIAMTAPVVLARTEAPTAPGFVTASGGRGRWRVRFFLPRALALETLPRPRDPRIVLGRTPAGRWAVVRFSGLAHPAAADAKAAELRTWMASKGLRVGGPASLAQYDPPWTLWFLRRNEVLISVAP